ncbi:spermidine synthase [Novosphingobium sp. FSY-8]|uniref:Spermidine synthase n=1 Tax=Novosphingobium ovatum TaxID=1908523 RepID=A0ABW9X9A0_9SPHN|nr:spermidine synthase [Novosphingobium ovatum]NBC35114.1 spermidine synthase [Novosphingobium ovatum]
MSGYQLVDTAHVPGGAELRLIRKGDEFAIVLEQHELMSTDIVASEEALATMTCERLDRPAAQMLIGGYGMGFTLRAALAALGAQAEVVVAEIAPAIIAWARGAMHQITAGCLDDARVTLVNDDVGLLIHSAVDGYDAILLDVDNGPEGLTRRRNDTLYSPAGLAAARMALRPGGILAIWSASGEPAFTRRLERAGFEVSEVGVQARKSGEGGLHHIWFARNR